MCIDGVFGENNMAVSRSNENIAYGSILGHIQLDIQDADFISPYMYLLPLNL